MHFVRTATGAIALLTALVWLLTAVIGANERAAMVMGVVPARLSGLIDIAPAVPAWLTPLSATLVHGGWLHLFFNLLMLIWCGHKVERVLGPSALVLLYVAGAYTAAIGHWLVAPVSPAPGFGASGAISAVVGAFALMFSSQKPIVRSPRLNRTLNALWLLAAWVALQMLTGLVARSYGLGVGVAAHIGGFVAGLLLQRPLLLWRYRNA